MLKIFIPLAGVQYALNCYLTCIKWGNHDNVIKWKHFPHYLPFVRGVHQSPVNSPHKGQWHGALMFSLICAWTNGCVNNRWLFETPSRLLWRHCTVIMCVYYMYFANVFKSLRHSVGWLSRSFTLCISIFFRPFFFDLWLCYEDTMLNLIMLNSKWPKRIEFNFWRSEMESEIDE